MRRAAILAVLLVLGAPAIVQAGPCEAERQTLQILADALTRARQRQEIEAAQALAALMRRIEQLEQNLVEAKQKEPGSR